MKLKNKLYILQYGSYILIHSLSIVWVGTVFIFSINFWIVILTFDREEKNILLITDDFNHHHNPLITLNFGLHCSKNINYIILKGNQQIELKVSRYCSITNFSILSFSFYVALT